MTTEIIPVEHIIVFNDQQIRRVMHNDEWFYSIIDVVSVLTGSNLPKRYWSDLKAKLTDEEGSQPYDFIVQLKLIASDGKARPTDCSNAEGIFRIIQSIPSPKAEPFKLWLAQVGYERVKEIEDPELASQRARAIYKENLRDHMNDLELIFTMLGEASTTAIARTQDAQGFTENKDAAQRGGAVAGKARKELELETGEKVVTGDNYLHLAGKEVEQLEQ